MSPNPMARRTFAIFEILQMRFSTSAHIEEFDSLLSIFRLGLSTITVSWKRTVPVSSASIVNVASIGDHLVLRQHCPM